MVASTGIVVVRQAGSAAALVPVAEQISTTQIDCSVVVIAYMQAVPTCREVSQHPDKYILHSVDSEEEAQRYFERYLRDARFVLTGTSFEAEADAYFWRQARSCGVESIAYLDQWANIEQRFPSSSRNDWPDNLAVIDEHDRNLAQAIAPAGVQIHITGSPALDNIKRQVNELRAEGVRADPCRIVFATEPVHDPIAYKQTHGFNDEDSFELAIRLIRARQKDATLVLRLHPRDSRDRWIGKLPADIRTEWDNKTRAESLACAGMVIGMRSFFLLEAYVSGVPVLSVQPNRKTDCPLTDGRMTVIEDDSIELF